MSRIKEWKYKPKHISIMQEWDTLTLIDVGYELRLLLCDSLAIKIDNIKEIVTPEFRTKLFNLQKYFHKDILEKQQKAKAAAQILNNYYDDDNELTELRKELEILKMNHNIKEFELENLIKKYDGLQIQYQIILDENNSLKKKISASTNLFSYS